MYLDKALAVADYFNPLYEFGQERTTAEQYPWTQELEFLQMVRALNPQVFGTRARDFFPGYYQDDEERVQYLYANMSQFLHRLPTNSHSALYEAAIRGKLNKGSFDLAYIYVVRLVQTDLWVKFVKSLQGQRIGAESGAKNPASTDLSLRLYSMEVNAMPAAAPNYAEKPSTNALMSPLAGRNVDVKTGEAVEQERADRVKWERYEELTGSSTVAAAPLTAEEHRLRLAQRTCMQLKRGAPSKPVNPFQGLDPYAGLNKAVSDIRNFKALQAMAQPVHEVKHGVKHAPVMHRQNPGQQASAVAAALVLPSMAAVQASLFAQAQPPASRPRGQVVLGQAPGAPAVNARRLLGKLKVDARKK